MKIGMITDSLPDTDFETLLATAARLELDKLEFGCGNWSSAPHLKLDRMLDSHTERRDFGSRLSAHGIGISALNCSGNPLHPGEHGRRHDEVTRKTIKLASLMGVERVVMMSGCPGVKGDASANWITTEWPPGARFHGRAWNYITLGYGHGELWWRELIAVLAAVGYDDVFSIEHEDPMLPALEGVEKSVEFLHNVLIKLPRSRTVAR